MEAQLGVCLLNDSFPPPALDGVANAVLNYAEIIHRDLGSAVVVVPNYPGSDNNHSFPIVRYPSVKAPKIDGYRMGLPIPGIVREIKRYNIDIIHCHCPFVSALIANSLRQATKAPLIMTYHTKFDIDIANFFASPLFHIAAKRYIVSNNDKCDEAWVVSNCAGENLRGLGYQGDYIVMENGIDFTKGSATDERIEEVCRKYKLRRDVPMFLFVGRMMWYKNIRLSLSSLHKAKTQGARFTMVFVGDGADAHEIAEFVKDLSLQDECVFTGPIRDREELRAVYSCADMFLFPSTYDTAALVVREAAACGLASILVRGSGPAEPVTDGINAVLVEEDAESLSEAIIGLVGNRERMKTLGQHAMDELFFSWEASVAKAYERYQIVLEEHKGRGGKKRMKNKRAHKTV